MSTEFNDSFIQRCLASGKYTVRADGSILNHCWNKTRAPRVVKTRKVPSGYLKCSLCEPGKPARVVFVHRVVAIAFLGMPMDGAMQVDHLDRIRANNAPRNLEWVTPAENQQRAWPYNADRHDQICGKGSRSRQAKVTEAQALEIIRRCRAGETQRCVGQDFCLTQSAVSLIVSGKTWPHLSEGNA